MKIKDMITRGVGGVDVIFAGNSFKDIFDLNIQEMKSLINSVQEIADEYDFIIIDTAAGVSELIRNFIRFSTDVFFITNLEITAVNDFYRAYGFYLKEKKKDKTNYFLVLNKVKTLTGGIKLLRVIEENLKKENTRYSKISPIGVIVKDDDRVIESIQRRIPVVMLHDDGKVRGCFAAIIEKYLYYAGKSKISKKETFMTKILNSFR